MKKIQQILNRRDGGESFNMNSPENYYKEMCRMCNETEGNLHLEDGHNCSKCKIKALLQRQF